MFTKKEYDYTRSARREHARNLEYMEQPGVRVGISEIETERRSKINKAIIKMLIRVFKSFSILIVSSFIIFPFNRYHIIILSLLSIDSFSLSFLNPSIIVI